MFVHNLLNYILIDMYLHGNAEFCIYKMVPIMNFNDFKTHVS